MVCAFLFAVAYSAVGHGGASGYLALMAFTAMATKDASTLALAMNVGVSFIAFTFFKRAQHFSWKLAWPFLIASVPFAFLGGSINIPGTVHKWLLATVLLYLALVLIIGSPRFMTKSSEPKLGFQLGIGGGIGLLSGIVGVGGGIFLSPLILFFGWANARQTAAVSSLFILLNSIAGLVARSTSVGNVGNIVSEHSVVLLVAIFGAVFGSWAGANRMPDLGLRRLLGTVLLFAVAKLVLR